MEYASKHSQDFYDKTGSPCVSHQYTGFETKAGGQGATSSKSLFRDCPAESNHLRKSTYYLPCHQARPVAIPLSSHHAIRISCSSGRDIRKSFQDRISTDVLMH